MTLQKEVHEFIPIADTILCGNEEKYVTEAIRTKWVSSKGPFVKRFEDAFAQFVGTRYATSVSNGTAALHLAYHAVGIQKDDEVLMPNLSFIATANAAAYLGAKPVFVDVDPKTWNLDPKKIEEKITDKTKAIVCVHLYGAPCDMSALTKIAKTHQLPLIEDAAEAHGARFEGKTVGGFGDLSAFSFFGNKIITTGEGGMVVSNNSQLIDRVNFLKNHGMIPEQQYWHPEIAFNYRMTALQAGFGLGQLEGIQKIIQQKKEVYKAYLNGLSDISSIEFQQSPKNSESVWWMTTIKVPHRDSFMNVLKRHGIDSRRVFYPLSQLPPYHSSESFPVSEEISSSGVSLPSGAGITRAQIDYVIQVVRNFFSQN
ncbi:MAG: DegT/DnrJ/EryC1/StrS family aminotransferase [Candidatus Diapherotrites archaeon]|uniref:DegT/DnrJ/EryC1/StrS family aminotransferase n=1 Tax=Candidatus Iainarchaeum sp. TaxID=3101447 RepID=A0A8T4L485_9ARCH|nr:DegT/DnrJ/EryC1/StrS family aminotransferase [Candidatus Diapherotrites archaeon]